MKISMEAGVSPSGFGSIGKCVDIATKFSLQTRVTLLVVLHNSDEGIILTGADLLTCSPVMAPFFHVGG